MEWMRGYSILETELSKVVLINVCLFFFKEFQSNFSQKPWLWLWVNKFLTPASHDTLLHESGKVCKHQLSKGKLDQVNNYPLCVSFNQVGGGREYSAQDRNGAHKHYLALLITALDLLFHNKTQFHQESQINESVVWFTFNFLKGILACLEQMGSRWNSFEVFSHFLDTKDVLKWALIHRSFWGNKICLSKVPPDFCFISLLLHI